VNSQSYASAALLPFKSTSITIEWESGWCTETVWPVRRTKKLFSMYETEPRIVPQNYRIVDQQLSSENKHE